jgi:hypothetical protein
VIAVNERLQAALDLPGSSEVPNRVVRAWSRMPPQHLLFVITATRLYNCGHALCPVISSVCKCVSVNWDRDSCKLCFWVTIYLIIAICFISASLRRFFHKGLNQRIFQNSNRMTWTLCPSHQRCTDFILRTFLFCATTSFFVSSGLKEAPRHLTSFGFAQPPSLLFGNLRPGCCAGITGQSLKADTFRNLPRRINRNSISRTSAILSMGGKGDARGGHEGFDFVPRRGEMSDATVTHFEFVAECDLPTERQSRPPFFD